MVKPVQKVIYFPPDMLVKVERHGKERGCTTLSETVRDMCRYAMDRHRKPRIDDVKSRE